MSEVRDTAESRRLFGHLVATRPLREGRSAAAATAASLGFHGAVLGALVWATLSVGQAKPSAKSEMMALYTPTPEAPPPPVAPPPPPKVAPPQVQAQVAAQVTQPKPVAAPQYKGFQTLTPPAVAPPDIPPPSLSSAVREEDYSGEGVAGGSSKGTAPLAAQHTVTAEDVVYSWHRSASPRLDTDGHSVRVGIADRGVGLPPGGADRLFEPFYTTKKSGGTGLGLAISRDIVRRHGGDIQLAPREGGGVEAVVTLPYSAPAP